MKENKIQLEAKKLLRKRNQRKNKMNLRNRKRMASSIFKSGGKSMDGSSKQNSKTIKDD